MAETMGVGGSRYRELLRSRDVEARWGIRSRELSFYRRCVNAGPPFVHLAHARASSGGRDVVRYNLEDVIEYEAAHPQLSRRMGRLSIGARVEGSGEVCGGWDDGWRRISAVRQDGDIACVVLSASAVLRRWRLSSPTCRRHDVLSNLKDGAGNGSPRAGRRRYDLEEIIDYERRRRTVPSNNALAVRWTFVEPDRREKKGETVAF